jgi:hypothetical protein
MPHLSSTRQWRFIGLGVIVSICPLFAQQATLTQDAEFFGALLDATKYVEFNARGGLRSGALKKDFRIGGMTFQAGSQITFHYPPAVASGKLAADTQIDGHSFAAGLISLFPNGRVSQGYVKAGNLDANIDLVSSGQVSFNESGIVTSFNAEGLPVGSAYPVLGMTLRTPCTVNVRYDAAKKAYDILTGNVYYPTIISRIITKRVVPSVPALAVPIVVPPGTEFSLRTKQDPLGTDRWTVPGRYAINGIDVGINPTILIRDHRLVGV